MDKRLIAPEVEIFPLCGTVFFDSRNAELRVVRALLGPWGAWSDHDLRFNRAVLPVYSFDGEFHGK
jgi:hypothetical protein